MQESIKVKPGETYKAGGFEKRIRLIDHESKLQHFQSLAQNNFELRIQCKRLLAERDLLRRRVKDLESRLAEARPGRGY